MSTAELLKRVKALPPRERRRFVLAVLQIEDSSRRPSGSRPQRVRWPDVEARARRIFGNRVLPNLVLTDREESVT